MRKNYICFNTHNITCHTRNILSRIQMVAMKLLSLLLLPLLCEVAFVLCARE